MDQLLQDYPWISAPLVVGAPMRQIALAPLAIAISQAGGFGFVAVGDDDSSLPDMLEQVAVAQSSDSALGKVGDVLPVGVGFFVWGGLKLLEHVLPTLKQYRPAAVWLYAANDTNEVVQWTQWIREATQSATKVWIQVGSVKEATEYTKACQPDVLVVQGQDAGGHGLMRGAGIITLFPEVQDALSSLCNDQSIKPPILIAAGGIIDSRGAAAALALGASGFAMGTRYLASFESNTASGYRDAVVQASDGGQATERTKLYDSLRGTTKWPERYGGRGVLNQSFFDAEKGLSFEDNKRLYQMALEKGEDGWSRLTTYAGTGVGLVKGIQGAAEITKEVREGTKRVLDALHRSL